VSVGRNSFSPAEIEGRKGERSSTQHTALRRGSVTKEKRGFLVQKKRKQAVCPSIRLCPQGASMGFGREKGCNQSGGRKGKKGWGFDTYVGKALKAVSEKGKSD